MLFRYLTLIVSNNNKNNIYQFLGKTFPIMPSRNTHRNPSRAWLINCSTVDEPSGSQPCRESPSHHPCRREVVDDAHQGRQQSIVYLCEDSALENHVGSTSVVWEAKASVASFEGLALDEALGGTLG